MINPKNLKVPPLRTIAKNRIGLNQDRSKRKKLTLSNSCTVPECLNNRIFKQVMDRTKHLEHGRMYTLKKLCGYNFWDKLGIGEPSTAGICMHEWVKQNRVPFIVAETAHEYPKKYYLI